MLELNEIQSLLKEHVKRYGRCSCQKEEIEKVAEKIGISFDDFKKFQSLIGRNLYEELFRA